MVTVCIRVGVGDRIGEGTFRCSLQTDAEQAVDDEVKLFSIGKLCNDCAFGFSVGGHGRFRSWVGVLLFVRCQHGHTLTGLFQCRRSDPGIAAIVARPGEHEDTCAALLLGDLAGHRRNGAASTKHEGFLGLFLGVRRFNGTDFCGRIQDAAHICGGTSTVSIASGASSG